MADLNREFDAENISPADPFEIIPDNTIVKVVLDKSEMKATKANDGHYLSCTFVVIEGPYEGRLIFSNMNLDNKNEKAVKIAERELSALCHAAGKLKVSDSDELHGIPVLAKLGIEDGRGDFPSKNKIKTFLPVDGAKKPTTTSEDVTAPGVKKAAPWGKKA